MEKLCEKILLIRPDDYVVESCQTYHNNISLSLMFTGEYKEALVHAKRGQELINDEIINTKLALAYLLTDQYSLAITVIKEYRDKEGKPKYRFESKKNRCIHFASRYITDDYQQILQTLAVLDRPEYNKNIILYIIKVMRKFQDKKDIQMEMESTQLTSITLLKN